MHQRTKQGLILLGIAALLALTAIITYQQPKQTPDYAASCAAAGGEWNDTYRECATPDAQANISGFCIANQGSYDGCASPCRHDPSATICNQLCVQSCTLA